MNPEKQPKLKISASVGSRSKIWRSKNFGNYTVFKPNLMTSRSNSIWMADAIKQVLIVRSATAATKMFHVHVNAPKNKENVERTHATLLSLSLTKTRQHKQQLLHKLTPFIQDWLHNPSTIYHHTSHILVDLTESKPYTNHNYVNRNAMLHKRLKYRLEYANFRESANRKTIGPIKSRFGTTDHRQGSRHIPEIKTVASDGSSLQYGEVSCLQLLLFSFCFIDSTAAQMRCPMLKFNTSDNAKDVPLGSLIDNKSHLR